MQNSWKNGKTLLVYRHSRNRQGTERKGNQKRYETFKNEKFSKEMATISEKHGLKTDTVKDFVDGIIGRMIFDGEQLTDLLAPLELNWKARREKELALMADLTPVLNRLAQGKRFRD